MVLGIDTRELAPAYLIRVQGIEIDKGVTDLIDNVTYESSDGVADMMKVNVHDYNGEISDSKLFSIGNEMELWGGYGPELEYIGAVVIAKNQGMYPDQGMPTMTVTGYTRDSQMVDNSPPEVKRKKGSKKKGKGGRVFKDSKYSDAVISRAQDYGFVTDVDPTLDSPHDFMQKSGMNDYEFIQGMSNLTGYVFWVDRSADGRWILHFKNPDILSSLQTKKYTFTYRTEKASLFSFAPEMTFIGSHTKVLAHVKNAKTGKLLKATFEDGKVGGDTAYSGNPDDKIIEPPPSGGGVKLYLGDFSVDVQTTKQFATVQELEQWTKQWFRKNRSNFVIAQGRSIGVETLTARTIHAIKGVATLYDGDYQFDRVKHVFDSEGGYICDWHGRKVLPTA